MNKMTMAEYIWLDGTKPTQQLRSKTRILPFTEKLALNDLPEWSFDGSSTNQATGHSSDLGLAPVFVIADPIRGSGNFLVMCEVLNADGTIHPTNNRSILRKLMEKGGDKVEAYVGFEQEYTFFQGRSPLGWPKDGYPSPQGPFYCGVGAEKAFGRAVVEEHMKACLTAGLCFYGINAEVMPGQWEFQIGYRGVKGESADPLTMSDHLWIGRYLLQLIAEKHGVTASFDNKPVKGDWNGAGMHTNFSTKDMRCTHTGRASIERAIVNLEKNHKEHISDYGAGLEERLTGHHETCSIHQFRSGASDRGASIRIPLATAKNGYGYIEDRRPGANSDPYLVSARILSTVCELDFEKPIHRSSGVAHGIEASLN